MSSCRNFSHVGLSFLTSGAGRLQQLTLACGSHATLALANSLTSLSTLQSVKLDGCPVTSAGLTTIENWCISLSELSLSKYLGVADEGLFSLVTKHNDLKKLDTSCCGKITDVSIAYITSSCTNFTSLRMESCILVRSEAFVFIGQQCLKSISKCSKLSSLKLGICVNISNMGLSHIGMKCSKVAELDLYRYLVAIAILDPPPLSHTPRQTNLCFVNICPGSSCSDLEMINVSHCIDVTKTSLLALSKCSRLNTYESRGCPLITSLGLAAIAVGNNTSRTSTDIGGYGLFLSLQITSSYSSVTDVGLN
ncbi:hypothetical protein SADUNF_Sadunf06G0083100 [Salix dunnii]|uniref:F-box/LRR-repeat protein 15-like leucin rich repeat domain-containing protein n=1 Tax=Salix dunnii TaxID=1413687 RepID=A0A835K3R1_9ROSI|nr:hypothetical protein SADUNF_Sadunf06G0083100 [Salix dunnii]